MRSRRSERKNVSDTHVSFRKATTGWLGDLGLNVGSLEQRLEKNASTFAAAACRMYQMQTERGFKEYLAYLPPLEIATEQAVILTFLGSVFHTK